MEFLDKEKLLSSTSFDFADKTVLVRIDADVDLVLENGRLAVDEDFRLKTVLPTLKLLFEKRAKRLIIVGHIGRPDSQYKKGLSLQPVADWFAKQSIARQVCFVDYKAIKALADFKPAVENLSGDLIILDNIRFLKGEQENDKSFISTLASLADVYINEAFGVSHRNQASITGLPKIMPSFAGLRLEAEVRSLSHIKNKAARPLVFVLGGSKLGKLDYIKFLSSWADKLLIGGKLPTLIKEQGFEINKDKVVLADLTENGKDISSASIEKFKQEIEKAQSIFWAGPMGVYEQEENRRGTTEVVEFISKCSVFKVAGGGDTHRVLTWLKRWDCFDFVSVGGGSALQFLQDGSLPGIDALR